ncbi:MAG: twin-arginine translocation pathway signal [Burkholderiales bacterium]|nr:twin-arginine translocation pathway signal [Burkholderiales bacterium]
MSDLLRRLRALPILLLLAACAAIRPAADSAPPIVFVHGNGDTAALWHTTQWRFESNGYERKLLHAVDLSYPLARSVDTKAELFRSSTAEQMAELAREVAQVRKRTGREKVVLVGSSRGGNAIRNYLKNGGGAAYVSHAILGGTPNHGVFDWEETRGSEFNGKGAFLTQLNAGPDEVVAGVRFMTIRSDNNDKYAQPDGAFLGKPGRATGVGYDGPELKGAENVVIPKIDHRETAFSALAFAQMYRFVTGHPPARTDIVPEAEAVLNGKVNVMQGSVPTNLPTTGARVEIFEVSAATGARVGAAVHTRITTADGLWGPFRAKPDAYYEFVVQAPGHVLTHIYRSPFPRSSDIVHLRPGDFAKGDANAGSVVVMSRPRGYFGHGRDTFLLDGKVPPGINKGVPGGSTGKILLPEGPLRPVVARFNDETITVQNWPAKDKHLVIAEFHY